jgi:hypothetical protein
MDVSPEELWPAEHQMEMVQVAWAAADLCDPAPAVRLVAATSSEPDDATGVGDGATTEDIGGANLGTPDTAIDLRAERAAVGPGRTYQIEYQAMDGSGNIASALGVVTVPRDQGHGPEGLLLNVDQDGAGRVRWYWSQWGSAASYDLLTGDLTSVTLLPNLVSLGPTEVMARERIDPWFEDSGERSPGQGRCYFYVVQGRTERGGWGYGEIPLPWPRAPESCAGGCP